jgi:hypothetical protein
MCHFVIFYVHFLRVWVVVSLKKTHKSLHFIIIYVLSSYLDPNKSCKLLKLKGSRTQTLFLWFGNLSGSEVEVYGVDICGSKSTYVLHLPDWITVLVWNPDTERTWRLVCGDVHEVRILVAQGLELVPSFTKWYRIPLTLRWHSNWGWDKG